MVSFTAFDKVSREKGRPCFRAEESGTNHFGSAILLLGDVAAPRLALYFMSISFPALTHWATKMPPLRGLQAFTSSRTDLDMVNPARNLRASWKHCPGMNAS
jgi:hypothetical protein